MNGDIDWRQRGLCVGKDPEIWFPQQADRSTRKAAVAICKRCPVVKECRATATARPEPYGVWGAETQIQRNKASGTPARLRSSGIRTLQPCGTPAAYRRHLHNDEVPCTRCMAARASSRRKS